MPPARRFLWKRPFMVSASYRDLYIDIGGGGGFLILVAPNLHFPSKVCLDIALQLDDLYKIHRPFIIPDVMFPGFLIFLDKLAILFHDPIQREKRALAKRKSGGDGTVAAGVLRIQMEVATDRRGHMHFIGPVTNLLRGPRPVDLLVGLSHNG